MTEQPTEDNTPQKGDHQTRFRGEVLDLADRHVRLEPVMDEGFIVDEYGKQHKKLKGMGFHMHAKSVMVDENGASEEWTCDYVALSAIELAQLSALLNDILIIQEEE